MFALVQNDPRSLAVLGQMKTLPLVSQLALKLAYLVYVWTARSRSRAVLARLPDHRLADLGLTRQAARTEANKWFWMA